MSLYPLRTERLGPVIDRAIAVFERHGLVVQPGAMSTVIAGDGDAVFTALRAAFAAATADGEAVIVVTLSNGCPAPAPGG